MKSKEEIISFLQENLHVQSDKKEEESPDAKKIICFICSQELPGIEEWKNHIVNSHVENEEFLICPECHIPCRDLKSHYFVHHKEIKLPKLESYTVKKMYDWDQKYRVMQRKKRKWKEGVFDSIKMGKKIHYRSSWERDVMICLEKCTDVEEYYGDSYLCIPYYIRGHKHKYWPDFTLKMKNGEVIIVEIKPVDQAEWEINQAKWKHAVLFCNNKGWKFQVWTQKHIRKIKTRATRHDVLLYEHVIPSQEDVIKEISVH